MEIKKRINRKNSIIIETTKGEIVVIRGGHHIGYYNIEVENATEGNIKMEIDCKFPNMRSWEYYTNWVRVNNSFDRSNEEDFQERYTRKVCDILMRDRWKSGANIKFVFDYCEYDPQSPNYIPTYTTFNSTTLDEDWNRTLKEFISKEDNEKYHEGELDLKGIVIVCDKLDKSHPNDESTFLTMTKGQERKIRNNPGNYKVDIIFLDAYNNGELYRVNRFELVK